MISTAFEYSRATSLDDALAKLRAANGEGKLIAGGHSLVPLMKLRLSEPEDADRHRPHSGPVRHPQERTARSRSAPAPSTTTWPHPRCCSRPVRCWPRPRPRSAIRRSAIAARSAAAWPTPIPSADYPAAMLALDADIHVKGPKGSRVVKAHDFFRGLFTVDLAADEIIVGVQFKPVKCAAYAKLYQRASHFAIVGVAAALDVEQRDDSSRRESA